MRQHFPRGAPLTFSLTPAQVRLVETVAAGLPSERQRNSLRVRVSGELKMVAWGVVPDELLDRCIASALAKIDASEEAA